MLSRGRSPRFPWRLRVAVAKCTDIASTYGIQALLEAGADASVGSEAVWLRIRSQRNWLSDASGLGSHSAKLYHRLRMPISAYGSKYNCSKDRIVISAMRRVIHLIAFRTVHVRELNPIASSLNTAASPTLIHRALPFRTRVKRKLPEPEFGPRMSGQIFDSQYPYVGAAWLGDGASLLIIFNGRN
jgi:hypothetical protein